MKGDILDKAAEVLRGIPGVRAVSALDQAQKQKVVDLESHHERQLSLPVRNLGVSLLAAREACFVVLKTGSFRPPSAPSVYLVEEGGSPAGNHALTVAGKGYTIVGEEMTGGVGRYTEPVIPLDESFVIFPQRRSGPQVPCFFLLPPLPFPELERVKDHLGIREILSISPSLVSDGYLRQICGFPPSNSFATLLVGFDLHSP